MAFYKELLKIGKKLESQGFTVLYPESALIMQKKQDFDPSHFKNALTDQKRGKFIKLHFQKILNSNAILVVNKTKNNITGYLGANVLMEMAIAFNATNKIYILHPISKKQPFQEEITAMSPTILNGKPENLK